MKRTLVTALATFAVASAAFAQQIPQPVTVDIPNPIGVTGYPRIDNYNPSVAVENSYVWATNILRRDSIRIDQMVPYDFGGVELRGIGQVFAPSFNYGFYNGSIYNGNNEILGPDVDEQGYIDQFKGAGITTIDSVTRIPMFKNYRQDGALSMEHPGKFVIYRSKFNFNSASYKSASSQGYVANRTDLEKSVMYTKEVTTEDFDATLDADHIVFTNLDFTTTPDGMLTLQKGESAVLFYINDSAKAVTYADTALGEFQIVSTQVEFREGGLITDENTGTLTDTLRNGIPQYKALGMLMFRQNGTDVAQSAWAQLSFLNGKVKDIMDVPMVFWGTTDLNSGVKYHFGKDATEQGLGNVSPNPVRESATLLFSLTERSHVKLDLFDMTGQQVRTLVEASYIPGNYSYSLQTQDLANGTYVVRMTAGEKVYTTKINVVK